MTSDQQAAFNKAWQELELAVTKRNHEFRLAVVANNIVHGSDARTVVLRHANQHQRTLRFSSDQRSNKFDNINSGDPLIWVFYSPTLRTQIRATGICTIHTQGELFETAWHETHLISRRCYLAESAPGSPVSNPDDGYPGFLQDREPTEEESEAGKPNFCVIVTEINSFDIYLLDVKGHRRCHYAFSDPEWSAQWLMP